VANFQPVYGTDKPELDSYRKTIAQAYHCDEDQHLKQLIDSIRLSPEQKQEVDQIATRLVTQVRQKQSDQGPLEAFMQQYDLSSEEGVLLMCLAEALLRVPDKDTAEKLIRDKLGDADWESHLGRSDSLLVNASTWGLMLTGRVVRLADNTRGNVLGALSKMVSKSGEPVIRVAVRQAMRLMGHQYVMGRTIKEALKRSLDKDNRAYRHSFDMLGEAALTAKDAQRYFESYERAIHEIGDHGPFDDLFAAPSISVKLSALHPRYEVAQNKRVLNELVPIVLKLAQTAKTRGIALTIDAEESERLQLSLDLFEQVYTDTSLDGWEGLGLAIQAYQKRCPAVIEWLQQTAEQVGRRIPVRLVKGAYWDSEVKHAQEQGYADYPVFTRKANTDVSYLACAQRLLAARHLFYPQFATHNAQTLAMIYQFAGADKSFEYQRLHGMGEELYEDVIDAQGLNIPCRVYAPVGSHEDLLPYLVRRLLENGANTSFVNRIVDADQDISELIRDPIQTVDALEQKRHPKIPLPENIYKPIRRNSKGINLDHEADQIWLAEQMTKYPPGSWQAGPLLATEAAPAEEVAVTNPADRNEQLGQWQATHPDAIDNAVNDAKKAAISWDRVPVQERAEILEKAADLMEAEYGQWLSVCVKEAGKTIPDCIAEIREAADFCRYYAAMAREQIGSSIQLPGPTGESNHLQLHGRGVFVCISPWNFPLAIFIGQIAAALVSGNAVLAKPAEQTVITGYMATKLLHQAGIPKDVLQFLPGNGASIGAGLCAAPGIAGVAFTGSTQTAQAINRSLAAKDGQLAALVAETGGQNAMLADSSALPEQLVQDVIASAFHSAGQRCSAMRVLFIQTDVADKVLEMLVGAMDELTIGDPSQLTTDIGPVIDQGALDMLESHALRMDREAKIIGQLKTHNDLSQGSFFLPRAYELQSLDQLQKEVFGPVLHVIRYRARDLDQVIDAVNNTGYGLTLGIHSRIERTVEYIQQRVKVGNCYVNRNMIGAVVGVQPFGGEGLSGTGPKAGGPHYLHHFTTERTLTVNTAAVGGNASLLAMD